MATIPQIVGVKNLTNLDSELVHSTGTKTTSAWTAEGLVPHLELPVANSQSDLDEGNYFTVEFASNSEPFEPGYTQILLFATGDETEGYLVEWTHSTFAAKYPLRGNNNSNPSPCEINGNFTLSVIKDIVDVDTNNFGIWIVGEIVVDL